MNARIAALSIGALVGAYAFRSARAQQLADEDFIDGAVSAVNIAWGGVMKKFKPQSMSLAGLSTLRRREAFRSCPYKDANGYWTIGWGHLIKAGEGALMDKCITEEAASRLLASDLATTESAIHALVNIDLKQSQFDALVSFAFNIGTANFRKSDLLKKLNSGDFAGLAALWPKTWVGKAASPAHNGLKARRAEEVAMFFNGVYA